LAIRLKTRKDLLSWLIFTHLSDGAINIRERVGSMSFEIGESGNPNGRPKGSYGGRIMALASLDTLLAKKKNQKALMAALEKELLKDPVRFFKTVIMPLLPREAKLSFDHDGVIQWKSLLGGEPVGNADDSTDGKGRLILDAESTPLPDLGKKVMFGQQGEE